MKRPGVPLLIVAAVTVAYGAFFVYAEVEEQDDGGVCGSSYSQSDVYAGWPMIYLVRYEKIEVWTGRTAESQDTWSIRNVVIDLGVVLLLTASVSRCAILLVRLCRDRFKFSILGLLMVTASIAAAFALNRLLAYIPVWIERDWQIGKNISITMGADLDPSLRVWMIAFIGSFCFAYCGLEVLAQGLRFFGSRRTG